MLTSNETKIVLFPKTLWYLGQFKTASSPTVDTNPQHETVGWVIVYIYKICDTNKKSKFYINYKGALFLSKIYIYNCLRLSLYEPYVLTFLTDQDV